MTISINSQSFRDAAKKLEKLNSQGILDTDSLDKILVEEGYDPEKERDDFINQYSEYSNMSDEELDKLLNPETYIGLAIKQTRLVIQDIESKR